MLVSFALCLAFVEAPFLHVHQHEAAQRHPGALLHLHLRSVQPLGNGPEFRNLDPDDDAQFQDWFSATSTDTGLNPAIVAETYSISAPEFSGWTVEAPLSNGHDPPLLCIRNSRAPPA
jgi:hypothetical protein